MSTTTVSRVCAAFLLTSGLLAPGGAPEAKAPPFETPPMLRAADVLPEKLRSGLDFSVAPEVRNDGFMNRYRLRTSWGELDVVSTALLNKRVRETYAIRQIEETSKTKEFAESVGEAGKGAVRGAKHLVTEPVDTLSSAASGVGKIFGMAKTSVTGENDDASLKQAVGFAQTKRDYAAKLGVDVYSHNPLLQKRLEDLAWASWAGGFSGGLALTAIPGGFGVAVSVSKNTDLLQRIDVTRPPSAIRKDNRAKLVGMGVPAASTDRFLDDSALSPTQQSLVVVALEDMKSTTGRHHVIGYISAVPDGDVASYAVIQATLYSHYHRKEQPIARFERFGRRLVARTDDGGVVVVHPLDHLFWTDSSQAIIASVDPHVEDAPHKLLWVGIRASDAVGAGLAELGWTLREGALEALSGK